MHAFVTILLMLGFCVVLPLGLLRVFFDLLERIGRGAVSSNQGPIMKDQRAERSSP